MTSEAARLYAGEAVRSSPAPLILRADQIYIYLVLFTASGAVYRYGAVNTYLWYLIYAWTAARLSLELPTLLRMVLRNWAVFIWPALALASILWSAMPAASLRGGLQLLITTIISVFIGARFSLLQILTALSVVMFGAGAVSLVLLFAGTPDLFAEAGGFKGIFAHKNTLAIRMNLLIGACLILLFTTRLRLFALTGLGLGVYLLVLSKSATSQVLGLVTPLVLITLAVLKLDADKIALSAAAGVGFLAAVIGALFLFGVDPYAYVLESFGKDATLTGRTWLWERGIEQIDKHPILGGGYQAFWSQERSSEVLWIQHILLESVKGFHNVGIEVWNDLGIPGLASLIGVLLWYAYRTFRFHLAAPLSDGLFPVLFLLILIVSGSVNNSFFQQHELMHILVCAFFAATWLPDQRSTKRPGS